MSIASRIFVVIYVAFSVSGCGNSGAAGKKDTDSHPDRSTKEKSTDAKILIQYDQLKEKRKELESLAFVQDRIIQSIDEYISLKIEEKDDYEAELKKLDNDAGKVSKKQAIEKINQSIAEEREAHTAAVNRLNETLEGIKNINRQIDDLAK